MPTICENHFSMMEEAVRATPLDTYVTDRDRVRVAVQATNMVCRNQRVEAEDFEPLLLLSMAFIDQIGQRCGDEALHANFCPLCAIDESYKAAQEKFGENIPDMCADVPRWIESMISSLTDFAADQGYLIVIQRI